MENKFFLHRIRKDGDTYTKGIEVHDTLDAAIQAFHSQMKMGYNNPSYPNMKYISCMVTDEQDNVVEDYNEAWNKEVITDFFVHYIRHDGDAYTKGIDIYTNYNDAIRAFHTQLEYGYGNSKYPNVSFVSSKITGGSGVEHRAEAWIKSE